MVTPLLMGPAALTSNSIDDAIFHVASALQVPVLVLALLALALVLYELGSYLVELRGRRGRRFTALLDASERARDALLAGNRTGAAEATDGLARSPAMAHTVQFIVARAHTPGSDNLLNKALADFDLESQKRLGRTRMLVRFGPALGLMGTLIPLSPALTGLANGNTGALSHDLRVAFSVTVVGLLIGAVAFAISLSRDRMYSQDLSDLQYLAAVVTDPPDTGMISVTPHARNREDRAGDPLDGLVNLFDLGIVLSVAFLLAALSSLHLGGTITKHGLRADSTRQILIKPGQKVAPLPTRGARTIGRGVQAGVVYRLANGQLVYVQSPPAHTR